jgi:hypothetical protein
MAKGRDWSPRGTTALREASSWGQDWPSQSWCVLYVCVCVCVCHYPSLFKIFLLYDPLLWGLIFVQIWPAWKLSESLARRRQLSARHRRVCALLCCRHKFYLWGWIYCLGKLSKAAVATATTSIMDNVPSVNLCTCCALFFYVWLHFNSAQRKPRPPPRSDRRERSIVSIECVKSIKYLNTLHQTAILNGIDIMGLENCVEKK